MTPEELATIEARANEAQPGPWWVVTVGKNHDDGPSHVIMSEHVSITEAFAGGEIPQATDAAFMAKSRTDVPALLAEVRRLTAELSYAGRPRYSGDASVAVEAIDAAFTRGVEAMREAATKACARVEDEAELSSEGDVAMRCANRIRSLKVSP